MSDTLTTMHRKPGALLLAVFSFGLAGRILASQFTPIAEKLVPDLFVWSDTCNVYVLRNGQSALLINLGDGSVLEHLCEIGVKRVEWVLFTDHHREECQGAARLKGTETRVAAPKDECDLFERPTEFRQMKVRLEDRFTIHGASYVRPPIQPITVNRALESNEVFRWQGRELLCLDTRGASPGAMSYLLRVSTTSDEVRAGRQAAPMERDSQEPSEWVAFSGDVMLDGATMHTWYDNEWDYGFGAGIRALRKSVNSLSSRTMLSLLPAHGPEILRANGQLRDYGQKLKHLEELYVRGYGVEGASVAYQDKVSQPTVVSNVWQVSPHLFKFKRPNFWPNFGLIMAENGRALAVDCGLLDEKFLDQSLEGLREHYGLKQIDAVLITHMHGDHFLEAPHLRETWGTKIWALENMVDKMEHPERFDYSAPIQAYGKKASDGSMIEGVHVNRAFKPGATIKWEGYRFKVDWMPGQTEFALCLHGKIDGRTVAFTGDNIFGDPDDPAQTGHEAMVAHNSAILEEGYIYGAEFLKRIHPDILIGGHSFVMDHPGAFIERYRQWSYQMRAAFQALSSEPDYRYWFDPFWVRVEPYRVRLRPGQSEIVTLQVRNFEARRQSHLIEIHSPPGVEVDPTVVQGTIGANSRRSVQLRVKTAAEATPGVRIIALDVTLDKQRLGERFDFVVGVEDEVPVKK